MSVLVTGYPSIDHIARVSHTPAVGETARLLNVPDRVTYGGCGINVAVALRRLGFAAGAAVVLGDDDYGCAYRAQLGDIGVDTANVITLPGEQTSHSYLFLNPAGQYQNFFFAGAADVWSGDLTLHDLHSYRYVLVTVGQLAHNRAVVAQAQSAGVPVVWMMKSDVVAYPPDVLRAFLDASTTVIMNHIEADYVVGALDVASVTDLCADAGQTLVITHGAAGADVIGAHKTTRVPVVPVVDDALVDPTGAGDGFAAGYLAGLLQDADPVHCAQLGAVIASFVIEAVGCQTNLPDWEQAQARYQQYFDDWAGE